MREAVCEQLPTGEATLLGDTAGLGDEEPDAEPEPDAVEEPLWEEDLDSINCPLD